MSIAVKIPDNARVRYPVSKFTGSLVLGKYDFSVPANENIVLLEMNKESIYLLERINFSAQLNEGVWLKSQDTIANYPNFRLDFEKSLSASIYPEPVRCLNYLDNAEQLLYFQSRKAGDKLRITFTGKVNQVAETVGDAEISTQVSFTIYQIDDKNWINWFLSPGSKEFGKGLVV